MNGRRLTYYMLALFFALLIGTLVFGQSAPDLVYEHVFANGGGACTTVKNSAATQLRCPNLPTDVRSHITLSFTIEPDGGVISDGALTEIESDQHRSEAHDLMGITDLPDKIKIGDYTLTADFTGDGFSGETSQRLHVGRVGARLQVFVMGGTTTIDNQ